MNTDDMTFITHFVKANIQDEELKLNSALNVLQPLVNYKILNLQEYINVPVENEAIYRMLSIEEIVNTISRPDDTENSDNDGPEFSKISISLALSSIHNISLFLQQEDPSSSTQNRLTILRKFTRELNSLLKKTQRTLDDYVKLLSYHFINKFDFICNMIYIMTPVIMTKISGTDDVILTGVD
ncbi:3275_t:CDS:1, partial [Ambispora leptoticha]